MSLSKTNCSLNTNTKNSANEVNTTTHSKVSNCLVVRIDQDSDDNLQALFDSVLNPGDSKRPLQVPFRMRKLPNSFFNPPSTVARSPSVSHSRANSVDSAYDAGSQPNVSQSINATSGTASQTSPSTTVTQAHIAPNGLTICHSRAHSSPASLQQTYSVHATNITGDSASCVKSGIEPGFAQQNVGFNSSTRVNAANAPDRLGQCIGQVVTSTIPTFHMKQRSFDVVSPIQLQNELGALPPGWEQAKTNDGQIYYINHATKTTQWEDPRIQFKQQGSLQEPFNPTVNLRNAPKESLPLADGLGPLPEGWEQAFTDSGDIYFINHINRTTSWNDPRIPEFLQKPLKPTKTEMSWINFRQLDKDQEFFKQKQEQDTLTRHSASLQMDPFLSGDNHVRQESSDSGLSLSSNAFSVNAEFIPPVDDSMDCISENGSLNGLNALNGLECPDNLVSALQLEDNLCSGMFNEVQGVLNASPTKPDNLDWYKIN